MADIAASVLVRLKNKAAEIGRSNHLCLQLFCQEEFLRRLQRSRYSDNLILKGGLFIYAVTDFDSRVTVDVDFLLRNVPNTPEKLEPILKEIIVTDTGNDFMAFEVGKIEPIALAKKYAGISASIIVHIKNTRTVFSVDFGVGDVIVPHSEQRSIPTQLDGFDAPIVSTYSLETTIAEKLDAILSLMEYSSRMKDYYDILYLSRKFDFDGRILCDAISKTFANRNREFSVVQFDNLLALSNDAAMARKWTAFLKKIKAPDIPFTDIIGTIGNFLSDVVAAVVENRGFIKTWNAIKECWC